MLACTYGLYVQFYLISNHRRGRGLRKLPATPTQPSTLNLGHLNGQTDPNSGNFLGVDLFSFPRLETSPTRMKLLLQSLGKKAPQQQLQQQPPIVPRRSLPGRSIARWSRSLDDPVTFEEAVIAGRGSRQLPVVGPQQLLASGRGRGLVLSATKRELPQQPRGGLSHHHSNYVDSDEEEDWC